MNTRNQATERIAMEARQAAAKWSDVNLACPHPWGSGAAITFKREFLAARALIEAQQMGVPGIEVTELEAGDVLCQCDNELTVQELETMRCMACGKAVIA